jgi:predicted phage terminase large subunit-like protein
MATEAQKKQTGTPKLSRAVAEAARAAAELDFAAGDLHRFCCYIDPTKAAEYSAYHLRRLAARLEAIERGEINRLFVTMPPRHWKSSLASEKFPAWFLGRHPDQSIILAANAQNLSLGFSRNIRDTITQSERYRAVFPGVTVRPDAQSVSDWMLTQGHRSSCRAVGVGGTVSGRGGNLLLVDDPMADQQAFSRLHRDAVWIWYQNALRERLEPGGAIVLIASRWHEDDLAGRILKASKSGEGEPWEILHMPAIATEHASLPPDQWPPEAALWPARWPVSELAKIKKGVGGRSWSAKYQGSPKQTEGNIIESSRLIMIEPDAVPALTSIVRRWDLAFSDEKGADYVAGVKLGRDAANNCYILHVKQIHGRWPQSKPEIIRIAQQDGPAVTCAIEANGTQLGYYQDMKDDAQMRNIRVIPDKPEGSKEMRAEVWGSRLEDGIIFCVLAPSWNGAMCDQFDDFPNSDHDDIVDAMSGAWGILMKSFRLMMV